MSVHPLIYEYVASALIADRLAEAAIRRRASTMRPARDGDLGTWLRHVGALLAPLSLTQLSADRVESLRGLVAVSYEVARDGGVETDLTPGADDPPVVLLRMLGALASRTAGQTIPVSRRQGSRLRAAMRRLS